MDSSEMYLRIALAFVIFLSQTTLPYVARGDHYHPRGGGGPPPDPPGDGGDGPCLNPCGCATVGDPVFMKNGEYTLSVTDVYIPGRVLPVEIKRTYGSKSEYNSRFGYGWDMNYNLKVRKLHDPNTVILLNGENCKYEYTQDVTDPNLYVRSENLSDYLRYDDANDVFAFVKTKSGKEYDFDINGNLSAITDRNGNGITFEYDPNGLVPLNGPSEFFLEEEFGGPSGGYGLVAMEYKLKTITDDLGRKINFTYNSDGLLTDVNDFAGRTWTYTYGSYTNDLITATGPATTEYPSGLTTTYYYEDPYDSHNLTSIVDPNNQTVVMNDYDDQDMVIQQTVGDGYYEFDYDPDNKTVTITDREGYDTEMVYSDYGQLISRTVYTADPVPDSFTTTYAYNSNLQRIRKIFPEGNCIDYSYDSSGNKTGEYRKTSPSDPNNPDSPNVLATLYTYDPNFVYNVKTITDPEGNVTTYDYDSNGNIATITYPTVTTPNGEEAPVVSFTYNQFGQIETVTEPDDVVTKNEYYTDANDLDNYGRLWKVIVDANDSDPNRLEITTEYKYDSLGRASEVKDADSNITKYTYNDLDQLTQAEAPSPFNYKTYHSYNKIKKLDEVKRQFGQSYQITSFTYDELGNRKTITDPLGNVTTSGYDKNENLSSITDAENNQTQHDYNERDLLAKVTDANSCDTGYSYDDNGNLKEIKDAHNNTTSFSYDDFDRLTCITYPNDSNEVFSYDENSNITSKRNRKGQTIYYEYDAMNRLEAKTRPSEPNTVFTYDIAGRVADVNDLRSVSNGGGQTKYTYDRVGRVEEVVDTENRSASYEYDDLGRKTKLVYPDDSFIKYEYDELSRLKKIIDDSNNVLAQYTYDELSRRTLLTLGNDANAVYTYDLANRLTSVDNNFADANSTTLTFDYTHDDVGNRLTMTVDDTDQHSYTYDVLYQLTDVDYPDANDTTYSYDALENRFSVDDGSTTSYSSNILNQYTSVGGTNYTYDDNGNLTDDGTYDYYYDCENRLTDVNDASGQVASYKYDFMGRRVSKTVYGSPDVTTKYCYDGDQVIAEYDGNDTLLRKFFYGPGIDEPILVICSGVGVYFYHYDALGSVVALSDFTSGNLVESYSYDVFGQPSTTGSVGNPYFFTGRRYDGEAGLYYYRARYYNSYIGRFLQADPVGYVAGLNLYTYVHNNPVNSVDPEGTKEPITCLPCIVCLASFGTSCAIVCAKDGTWDCPDDTFMDCMNKCWHSIKKANKWIWWACKGACYHCVIFSIPKIPKTK